MGENDKTEMTKVRRSMTKKSVLGIQIECFNLCQTIGMEIVERGHGITANAVHFPVTHSQVKSSLEALKAFIDRALVAIDVAQAEWRKETCLTTKSQHGAGPRHQ